MTSTVLYELLFKSYEQYQFFCKNRKTILENTSEYQRKIQIPKNLYQLRKDKKGTLKKMESVVYGRQIKSYERFQILLVKVWYLKENQAQWYVALSHIPSGSQAFRNFYIEGCVDGWVSNYVVLLCFCLENFNYNSNNFCALQKTFFSNLLCKNENRKK